MSLTPPYRLQKLQAALHAKAKASPDQRFHALYDKVYRLDVLLHGYECCKANRGAAGVDEQTFEDFLDFEASVVRVADAEGYVFEITEEGEILGAVGHGEIL